MKTQSVLLLLVSAIALATAAVQVNVQMHSCLLDMKYDNSHAYVGAYEQPLPATWPKNGTVLSVMDYASPPVATSVLQANMNYFYCANNQPCDYNVKTLFHLWFNVEATGSFLYSITPATEGNSDTNIGYHGCATVDPKTNLPNNLVFYWWYNNTGTTFDNCQAWTGPSIC